MELDFKQLKALIERAKTDSLTDEDQDLIDNLSELLDQFK